MKFDNIIKLVKLGYTETQIKQIEEILDSGNGNTNTNPTPNPTPIPTPNPAPAVPAPITTPPTPTTAANTNEAPRAAETGKDTDANKNEPANNNPINKEESETVTLLKEMLGIIQKGNINNLSQQSMNNNPADLDGAAVLASIINPKEVTK